MPKQSSTKKKEKKATGAPTVSDRTPCKAWLACCASHLPVISSQGVRTAYMFFLMSIREDLKKKFPDLEYTEISKRIGVSTFPLIPPPRFLIAKSTKIRI